MLSREYLLFGISCHYSLFNNAAVDWKAVCLFLSLFHHRTPHPSYSKPVHTLFALTISTVHVQLGPHENKKPLSLFLSRLLRPINGLEAIRRAVILSELILQRTPKFIPMRCTIGINKLFSEVGKYLWCNENCYYRIDCFKSLLQPSSF